MRGKTMFLRLFLTLLLMAGLTVDFHTMSLGFGTSVYAYDDDGDWWDNDENFSFEMDDFVFTASREDDDPTWYVDWGWQFPEDPVTNDDDPEEEVEIEIPDKTPTEPTLPEEEEDCECKFGECDICGLCLTATSFRSSPGSAPSCPTCPGHPFMPDCDSIGRFTGKLYHHAAYENLANELKVLSQSGVSACGLLYEDQVDGQLGGYSYTASQSIYSDLNSAFEGEQVFYKDENNKERQKGVVGAIFSAGAGQEIFSDSQVLDFIRKSTRRFSTIYFVNGDHMYALRYENTTSKPSYSIDENGDFIGIMNDVYRDAMVLTNGDEIYSRAAEYNYMNSGFSLMQSTTTGTRLFQVIDAQLRQNSTGKYVDKQTCGGTEQ